MFKYKIGDKVEYLDIRENRMTGTIKECLKSNDGSFNLYFIMNYGYTRVENEILCKI